MVGSYLAIQHHLRTLYSWLLCTGITWRAAFLLSQNILSVLQKFISSFMWKVWVGSAGKLKCDVRTVLENSYYSGDVGNRGKNHLKNCRLISVGCLRMFCRNKVLCHSKDYMFTRTDSSNINFILKEFPVSVSEGEIWYIPIRHESPVLCHWILIKSLQTLLKEDFWMWWDWVEDGSSC